MAESLVEKEVIGAVEPFLASEFASVVEPIVKAKLVSASPQLQALETDLSAFICSVVPDLLASLAK